jgi:hypothetical protein
MAAQLFNVFSIDTRNKLSISKVCPGNLRRAQHASELGAVQKCYRGAIYQARLHIGDSTRDNERRAWSQCIVRSDMSASWAREAN